MKKYLVVGLGNPGQQFAGTRHNLGQSVLHAFEVPEGVSVYFPEAFMNDCGPDVAAYMKKNGWTLAELVVVHDELELPLGEVAWQKGGSAHGHNGIRSLIAALGSPDFRRLRLGIGRPPEQIPVDRFVLSAFLGEEQAAVAAMKTNALELLRGVLAENH
jgi:PTH1 family peptidyl-tRNA hydrolase